MLSLQTSCELLRLKKTDETEWRLKKTDETEGRIKKTDETEGRINKTDETEGRINEVRKSRDTLLINTVNKKNSLPICCVGFAVDLELRQLN